MSNPLIKVKNISKSFGKFKAVSEVSFSVEPGQIFGLLGPNGAGKTTTIRLISTIIKPDEGGARIAGFHIKHEPEKVRANIGVLTADLGVYDRFSGRENLKYFGRLYSLEGKELNERIDELARSLDMNDFIDRRAGGYSTGQKQKLAIARSVIHDPKVIIFDEPTLGLDVLASRTVLDYMKTARQRGRAIIFSTHQMSDAEHLCDQAAIMHQGRIVADDNIAALKIRTGAASLSEAFLKLIA